MIKISDLIAKIIAKNGIKHVFMVTGGGAMHLNDSFGGCKNLKCVSFHHEQACSIAAEGYARVNNELAVVNVTSGPGGINALNGVFGAWTDSIPMLIVSGQAKRATLMSQYNLTGLRQLGDQEVDIIRMVKDITKYSVCVNDPGSIRYHLEKAIHLAKNGRPGPCWIDVPVDVQGTLIEEEKLKGYDITEDEIKSNDKKIAEICIDVLRKIRNAERPVIIASTGIRLGGAIDIFEEVVSKLQIPVTTAWSHDVIYHDHPCYCGKQGSIGDRAGNFTVQNADLVLIIGSRMPIRQVSYNWENFAKGAYKIQIDIDEAELNKPTMNIDMPVHCDAKVFLNELSRQITQLESTQTKHSKWLKWCKERVKKYPVLLPKHMDRAKPLNPYFFLHTLQSFLNGNDIIVCGNATACIVTFQTSFIKKGQRLFSNSGCASMGYDLPAAIGASIAAPDKRVICVAGDGSFQMNIQELQTVIYNKLNVKIFVLNNGGYRSIQQTQQSFFNKQVGCGSESGLSFPDIKRVGAAYDLPTYKIDKIEFQSNLIEILNTLGPVICEVVLDPDQIFEPKLSSRKLEDGTMISAPLEDMYPFLDRKELCENMLTSEYNRVIG